jgi:hypothetical protein
MPAVLEPALFHPIASALEAARYIATINGGLRFRDFGDGWDRNEVLAEGVSAGYIEIIAFSSDFLATHARKHIGLSRRLSVEITSNIRSFDEFRR